MHTHVQHILWDTVDYSGNALKQVAFVSVFWKRGVDIVTP